MVHANNADDIFSQETLKTLFPREKADLFFDALYGDVDEGSYDIVLAYKGADEGEIRFELQLKKREGKCLRCNLTYGLPQVFSRHPVINIEGLAQKISRLAGNEESEVHWRLGQTREVSEDLHVIPLTVFTRN